jgi:hypothetical protein
MNDDKPSTLDGPRLDRAVAEAVMEWHLRPGGFTRDGAVLPDQYFGRDGQCKAVALEDGTPDWHPSADVAAAYEMESHVQDRRAYVECLVGLVTVCGCDCVREPGVCAQCWYAVAHATPAERCRAALLAVTEQATAEVKAARRRPGAKVER